MRVANNIQYMYTKIVLRTWYLHYSLHFKNAQKCEEMIEIIWIHPCKINKKISMAFNKFKFYSISENVGWFTLYCKLLIRYY